MVAKDARRFCGFLPILKGSNSMSINFFKDKKTKQPELREVCGDCGNIKGKSSQDLSDTTALSLESCNCKQKAPEASPSPPRSKEHVVEDYKRKNNINVILDGRYELIEPIGEGGMGTVYRAKDKVLNKEFAIKVLRNDLVADETAIRRFEQEAVIASGFTHVNILSVYGHGRTVDGAPYIVMDFLEGESLGQIISREGRLEPLRAINICMQICEALAHAHMQGLIHRDLKPSNIMLINNEQCTDMVKVLDFGIAKVMPSANRETQNLTQTGELFGSPSYMSPEQCLGCNLDARSDVYSIGCLMYEMLTGKPPFVGKNPIQTVVKHLNEEAPALSRVAPKLGTPVGLESIIMRCLEKDAELRFQSMDQLRFDLHLIVTGQVPKQPKKKKPIKPISLTLLFALPSGFIAFYLVISAALLLIGSWFPGASSYSAFFQSGVGWLGCFILLSYAIVWTTAIGQRWVELRNSKRDISKWRRFWHASTLASMFSGFFALVCLVLTGSVGLMSGQSTQPTTVPMLLSIVITTLFSFALISAIGRFINWDPAKMNYNSRLIKGLNSSYVLVLIVSSIFGRTFIAYNPFVFANMFNNSMGYDLAIFIDPNFPDPYYERGVRKLQSGETGAIEDFTKALNLHPKPPLAATVLLQRAKVYFRTGHYDKAIDDLSKIIADYASASSHKPYTSYNLNTSLRSIYIARAHCYQKIKQFEKALSDYYEAESSGTAPNCTLNDRGQLYEKLGDNNKALLDYSTSIDKTANHLPAYINRGRLYKKLNEPDKAVADFKTVLSCFSQTHAPTNAEEYRSLATAEQELGMSEKAKKDFAKVSDYASRESPYGSGWGPTWYAYEKDFPL
jgi:serine/threonine protein kinase/tetratricopeptide (TPR) repeat protein